MTVNFDKLTRCRRHDKYDPNHCKRQFCMLNDFSLVIKMLWSTRLKAFLKSIKRLRTEPPLSNVVIHLCWIAISACIVDLPGREPNWPSSNTGWGVLVYFVNFSEADGEGSHCSSVVLNVNAWLSHEGRVVYVLHNWCSWYYRHQ